ncbi:MAG: ASKHA domain-containing protein [Acidobacteriales bacterium]|nr:ASKHA domain-containing protein [Terriglobales bacterium]
MPSVHFLPDGVTAEVPAGTLIHEAAVRAGLTRLELPCGGQGSCGLCLVEVSAAGREPVTVMACQTKVREDITVRLPEAQSLAMQVVGDSHFLLSEDTLPDRASLSPLFSYMPLTVPPASIEEHYSDWLRLERELTRAGAPAPFSADLALLGRLASVLREQDGRIAVALQESDAGTRVAEVFAGHAAPRAFGLAIDIGTTTVAVQLVDLDGGAVIDTTTSYNLQIRRGADIISRIDYARTAERQQELRALVLETINGLVGELTGGHGIAGDAIRAAFIAGNTTMIHLLLGLEPRYIREAPYVPTVNPVPSLDAESVGLSIHPRAAVSFAPGVGSYVGGDITSGLLTTDFLTNHDDVFLFMDIGTNGEIVIGNADWMVACACSAGPAFEGSGIKCGMRASRGAIEQVEIGRDLAGIRYKVVGGSKPAGICGSGLISLLGELFLRGLVDQAGRFNLESGSPRLVETEQGRVFVIERGENTLSGEDLVITEADIENLVRTKGAIYAACSLILENVGLEWNAISRVYIAGGFGRYINVSDAVLIGMLPDLAPARFRYIGNSALTGAYIALLSRERRAKLGNIAAKMTYVDLSSDPRYMDSYVKALFLPHTDMNLFPTVTRRLESTRNTG